MNSAVTTRYLNLATSPFKRLLAAALIAVSPFAALKGSEESLPAEDHWAFQRIEEVPVPVSATGLTNPIDAFLQAKRSEHGFEVQPRAVSSLLIRRLYLDLVGLPPTLDQQNDPRPWSEIVDELLASPQHGERWGRHWMDIWRYSDWYGLGDQLRYSQKHMWRWRDWILESINSDKGYDRMILEMLAGDELVPDDPEVVRATGFLARNYYLFNRTTWLDSTIEHCGKAFLGLTLNCAKCHDHKYDPISQVDYYNFRAFFEPHQVRLDPVPGEVNLDKDGLPRVFDDHLDEVTYLHIRGDESNPDKDLKITAHVPVIFADFAPNIEPVNLPLTAYKPGARAYVIADHVKIAQAKLNAAKVEMAGRIKSDFSINDSFESRRADLWKISGGSWEYRGGALHLVNSSRADESVTLLKSPPMDFELVCHYKTNGGTTFKSVCFRFDQSADGESYNQVYTSAHGPGPKLQISHSDAGKDEYPVSGKIDRSIVIGESYTLRFAVRGQLINVWLNDEFQLAYNLPKRTGNGKFSFRGFDATATFDSIAIRALPENYGLKGADKSSSNIEQLESEIEMLKNGEKAIYASRKALETPEHKFEDYAPVYPDTSTGRRLALAEWMIHRDNPLTARVAVNHVWMRHFGEPLVDSVFDFGLRAGRPVHKDLLDFLALEFIESGWSLKHLHRLIVTSDAYQMSSSNAGASASTRKADPNNALYWRMNPRRMEAQIVRDCMLQLAGDLDLTFGGPSIDPKTGGKRRSLYFKHSLENKDTFLDTFDNADFLQCYRRSESIVPQQALALANSKLSNDMAERIAARFQEDGESFIVAAFRAILGRDADSYEQEACREFESKIPAKVFRARLVHVLLNHNDFITIR